MDHSVSKEYVCRVKGEFPTGVIISEDPIECISIRRGIHTVTPDGRSCITEFSRLSYDAIKNTSIVHCKPRTGRTHQIRVHLQHMDFPIVNDPLYGPDCTKYVLDQTSQPQDQKTDKSDQSETSSTLGTASASPVGGTPESLTEGSSRKKWTFQSEKSGKTSTFIRHNATENPSLGEVNEFERPERWEKFDKLPTHPWVDEKCPECWIDFKDPREEELRIDLHAWKYEGPGWKFETELPEWAKTTT